MPFKYELKPSLGEISPYYYFIFRKKDLLVDYISPVKVKSSETLLKVREYELSKVPISTQLVPAVL